jgi:hypothetical protein
MHLAATWNVTGTKAGNFVVAARWMGISQESAVNTVVVCIPGFCRARLPRLVLVAAGEGYDKAEILVAPCSPISRSAQQMKQRRPSQRQANAKQV